MKSGKSAGFGGHVTEFMGKLEVAAWKDESGLGIEVRKDGTREQKLSQYLSARGSWK